MPACQTTTMRDFLYRDRTQLAVYAKAMFGLALHKQQQTREAGDDPQEHRAVRGPGRREPDRLPAAAGRQLLVVLVRQRDRGQRLLPQAAGADQPQGREGLAAGEVPAQQPQARDLLEQHPRHGHLHRGHGRLPEGQRRGQAGHDRRGLARRQEAQGSQDRRHEPVHLRQQARADRRRGRDRQAHARDHAQGHRPGLLQRLPDQLHAGGLHHQGRPGGEGQPQVLQADAGRQERSRSPARAARRSTRRSRSTSGRSWRTWRRSRAATWWRSSWRSTARTTTST